MSIVRIRCPNCGSASSKGVNPDEYVCDHCGGKFTFVRPSDGVMIQDTRTHDCPICGRAVPAGTGNMCKHCNTYDLCSCCVQEVNHVMVCRKCLQDEGLACKVCGLLGSISCPICDLLSKEKVIVISPKYCEKHEAQYFYTYLGRYPKDKKVYHRYCRYYCKNCQKNSKEISSSCHDCVVTEGRFITKHKCRRCGEKLKQMEQDEPAPLW